MKMLSSVCFLLLMTTAAQAQVPQNGAGKPAMGNSAPQNTQAITRPGTPPQAAQQPAAHSGSQPQAAQQPAPAHPAPQGSAPQNSAPVQASAPVTTTPMGHSDSPVESILSEDLIRALRDPFQLPSILVARKETPKTDLEIYPLKDFKLNGVITGPKKTRAMVTTPSSKVFFVRIGDKMGVRDGTVTQILPDSIKVTEYYVDEHGKRMPDIYELTMSGEVVSLNKKEE